jgi:transposase
MRTKGSAQELEQCRRLAVALVSEGQTPAEVAHVFGVHPASVRKWWSAYQQHGNAGLAAKAHPGRKPKLTPAQQRQALRWLRQSPKSFGFATELWTAKRFAQVIERKWGVSFHPGYLSGWLTSRGITPQKPERQYRERDDEAIRRWRIYRWPRIQNARVASAPMWS